MQSINEGKELDAADCVTTVFELGGSASDAGVLLMLMSGGLDRRMRESRHRIRMGKEHGFSWTGDDLGMAGGRPG